MHEQPAKPETTDAPPREHVCPYCGWVTWRRNSLAGHLSGHARVQGDNYKAVRQTTDWAAWWGEFNHVVQPYVGRARLALDQGKPDKAKQLLDLLNSAWDDMVMVRPK